MLCDTPNAVFSSLLLLIKQFLKKFLMCVGALTNLLKHSVICGTFVFRNNQRPRLFHLEKHLLDGDLGLKGVLFSSLGQKA